MKLINTSTSGMIVHSFSKEQVITCNKKKTIWRFSFDQQPVCKVKEHMHLYVQKTKKMKLCLHIWRKEESFWRVAMNCFKLVGARLDQQEGCSPATCDYGLSWPPGRWRCTWRGELRSIGTLLNFFSFWLIMCNNLTKRGRLFRTSFLWYCKILPQRD